MVVVVVVGEDVYDLPPVFLSDVARSRRAAGKLNGAEPNGSSAMVGVAAIGVLVVDAVAEIEAGTPF